MCPALMYVDAEPICRPYWLRFSHDLVWRASPSSLLARATIQELIAYANFEQGKLYEVIATQDYKYIPLPCMLHCICI